jgi:peptide/nickel transport system permease protein
MAEPRNARRTWGRLGLALLTVMVAIAAVGPLFLPDPAAQPDITAAPQPPSWQHPLGTDQLSRDVLSRVVHGARISLAVAVVAVLLSLVLGAAVGVSTWSSCARSTEPSPSRDCSSCY